MTCRHQVWFPGKKANIRSGFPELQVPINPGIGTARSQVFRGGQVWELKAASPGPDPPRMSVLEASGLTLSLSQMERAEAPERLSDLPRVTQLISGGQGESPVSEN